MTCSPTLRVSTECTSGGRPRRTKGLSFPSYSIRRAKPSPGGVRRTAGRASRRDIARFSVCSSAGRAQATREAYPASVVDRGRAVSECAVSHTDWAGSVPVSDAQRGVNGGCGRRSEGAASEARRGMATWSWYVLRNAGSGNTGRRRCADRHPSTFLPARLDQSLAPVKTVSSIPLASLRPVRRARTRCAGPQAQSERPRCKNPQKHVQ
jgi:hypothetical protein